MQPVISVRGIVNRFGHQVVHDGVDLDVMPGEVFGIVGGSGSGKSVLLRTMLGLQVPVSGTVDIDGKRVTAVSPQDLLEVKRRYGVTFQHGALFTSLTVAQNVHRDGLARLARDRQLVELDHTEDPLPGVGDDLIAASQSRRLRRRAREHLTDSDARRTSHCFEVLGIGRIAELFAHSGLARELAHERIERLTLAARFVLRVERLHAQLRLALDNPLGLVRREARLEEQIEAILRRGALTTVCESRRRPLRWRPLVGIGFCRRRCRL